MDVNPLPPSLPQVSQTQATASSAPTQAAAQPKATKEAFSTSKTTQKLGATNVNALTQLNSKDQMMLMKLSPDQSVNKFAENLTNVRTQGEDILPRSLTGAGSTAPPPVMRAALAAKGKVFSGRSLDITIDEDLREAEIAFKISGKSFTGTVPLSYRKNIRHQDEDEPIEEIEDEFDDALEERQADDEGQGEQTS